MTTFKDLETFINKKMKMQHIYQPLFIKELLKNDGVIDSNTLAKIFLSYDKSQVDYYDYIIKTMPSRVLKKHHVIEKGKNIYTLNSFANLSSNEIEQLITLCDEKIENYLNDKKDIFDHRKRNQKPVSGSIRYEILKRAKGRCESCGISSDERAIDVDHIVPKNKGGTNDKSNLQALCYQCNREKRDTDDTNFKKVKESYNDRDKDCLFCNLEKNSIKIIAQNELAIAFYDGYPVTKYHTLVIPKRHVSDYFELHQPEINAINQLIFEQKENLQKKDKTITGFNVGINSGEDAGQTIFHVHMHLIPRRKGDMKDPKGGVRGVIPEKQNY